MSIAPDGMVSKETDYTKEGDTENAGDLTASFVNAGAASFVEEDGRLGLGNVRNLIEGGTPAYRMLQQLGYLCQTFFDSRGIQNPAEGEFAEENLGSEGIRARIRKVNEHLSKGLSGGWGRTWFQDTEKQWGRTYDVEACRSHVSGEATGAYGEARRPFGNPLLEDFAALYTQDQLETSDRARYDGARQQVAASAAAEDAEAAAVQEMTGGRPYLSLSGVAEDRKKRAVALFGTDKYGIRKGDYLVFNGAKAKSAYLRQVEAADAEAQRQVKAEAEPVAASRPTYNFDMVFVDCAKRRVVAAQVLGMNIAKQECTLAIEGEPGQITADLSHALTTQQYERLPESNRETRAVRKYCPPP